MVVNENTIVSIVKDFILIVAKVKQRRDFRSGLKQRSERSQWFYFNNSEVKGCSD